MPPPSRLRHSRQARFRNRVLCLACLMPYPPRTHAEDPLCSLSGERQARTFSEERYAKCQTMWLVAVEGSGCGPSPTVAGYGPRRRAARDWFRRSHGRRDTEGTQLDLIDARPTSYSPGTSTGLAQGNPGEGSTGSPQRDPEGTDARGGPTPGPRASPEARLDTRVAMGSIPLKWGEGV